MSLLRRDRHDAADSGGRQADCGGGRETVSHRRRLCSNLYWEADQRSFLSEILSLLRRGLFWQWSRSAAIAARSSTYRYG